MTPGARIEPRLFARTANGATSGTNVHNIQPVSSAPNTSAITTAAIAESHAILRAIQRP